MRHAAALWYVSACFLLALPILSALCVICSMLLAGLSPSARDTACAHTAQPSRSDLQQQHAPSSRVASLGRARQHAAYPNPEAPASTRAARAAEATSSGHQGCAAGAAASDAPALHRASRHVIEQRAQPSSPAIGPASCDGAGVGAALQAGMPVQLPQRLSHAVTATAAWQSQRRAQRRCCRPTLRANGALPP